MNDITERLRDPEFFARTGRREELVAAADEIDRLRDLVAKREDLCGDLSKQLGKAREATLLMVASLFAESIHETYSRDQIVSIVEDIITLSKEPPQTDEQGSSP